MTVTVFIRVPCVSLGMGYGNKGCSFQASCGFYLSAASIADLVPIMDGSGARALRGTDHIVTPIAWSHEQAHPAMRRECSRCAAFKCRPHISTPPATRKVPRVLQSSTSQRVVVVRCEYQ